MQKILALAIALSACTNTPRTSTVNSRLTIDVATDVSLSSGDNNDVTIYPYPGEVGVTGTSTSVLTGIDSNAPMDHDGNYIGTGAYPGQEIYIRNVGSNVLVFAHDRTSQFGNKIWCPGGRDFVLAVGRGVQLIWDPAIIEWRVLVDDTYLTVVATTSTRVLNTPWQNTTGRTVFGLYSVRVTVGLSLTTGAAGHAELAIGASSGSITTVCGREGNSSTGTLVVGLSLSSFAEGQLSCFIPPGAWAQISTTNEVGTPTFSLTAQLEQSF